jgi:hypothetical protein
MQVWKWWVLSRQTHGFYTFLYQTSGFLHLLCSVEEKEHHVLFLSLSLFSRAG